MDKMGPMLVPAASVADLERDSKKRNTEMQASATLQGLAAHVRRRWETARDGRRDLEERMLECLRQRNGEYDPSMSSDIKQQGGSEIFIRTTSVKCRAATSWLRDTLLGKGTDKPWSIDPTPEPDLPEDVLNVIKAELATQLQAEMQQGMPMPDEGQLREIAQEMEDEAYRAYQDEAEMRVRRMERKMEDQLTEGGWSKAFNEFIDDVVTFPFACIKGPIKRRRKIMQWKEGKAQGFLRAASGALNQFLH